MTAALTGCADTKTADRYNTAPYIRRLQRGECLALLAAHDVGRLGFVADGYVTILPVNYAFSGSEFVIRTGAGLKLEHAPLTAVALEIDEIDPARKTGWSVLVRGAAREVTSGPEYERLVGVPLASWAPGPKDHVLAILPKRIEGRRIWRDAPPPAS